MNDRIDRDRRDREVREEEDERQAETDRRGRELKEAWRQHHPRNDKPPKKRGMDASKSSEEPRERLLDAGWEVQVRGAFVIWPKPGGHGSWYSQDVALEILEALEEEKNSEEDK